MVPGTEVEEVGNSLGTLQSPQSTTTAAGKLFAFTNVGVVESIKALFAWS